MTTLLLVTALTLQQYHVNMTCYVRSVYAYDYAMNRDLGVNVSQQRDEVTKFPELLTVLMGAYMNKDMTPIEYRQYVEAECLEGYDND